MKFTEQDVITATNDNRAQWGEGEPIVLCLDNGGQTFDRYTVIQFDVPVINGVSFLQSAWGFTEENAKLVASGDPITQWEADKVCEGVNVPVGSTKNTFLIRLRQRLKMYAQTWTYIGMSHNPNSPMGFRQHGELKVSPLKGVAAQTAHMGDVIPFSDLPDNCKHAVLHDLNLMNEED